MRFRGSGTGEKSVDRMRQNEVIEGLQNEVGRFPRSYRISRN